MSTKTREIAQKPFFDRSGNFGTIYIYRIKPQSRIQLRFLNLTDVNNNVLDIYKINVHKFSLNNLFSLPLSFILT